MEDLGGWDDDPVAVAEFLLKSRVSYPHFQQLATAFLLKMKEPHSAICACNWFVAQEIGGKWIHQNGEMCGLDKCISDNPGA